MSEYIYFCGQKYEIRDNGAEGDCLFRCIDARTLGFGHRDLRALVVDHILFNWRAYEENVFNVFDIRGREEYAALMRQSGTYASLIELRAAAEILQIYVILACRQPDGSVFSQECGKPSANPIYLLFTGNPESGHFRVLVPVIGTLS